MPTEPQKDVVEQARSVLAKDTPAPWLRIDPELLRQLADEVERLRSVDSTLEDIYKCDKCDLCEVH